jgi:CBS domain-containing protein
MQIKELMSRDVQIAAPDETIQCAAARMSDLDIGALPVGKDDRLVGIITDRDITLRAVARGRDPDTKVRDVMTENVMYAFDDEPIELVAADMADLDVRRLPVVDHNQRLVGIVSLSDVARETRHLPPARHWLP